MNVEELMSKDVVTVRRETPLKEVATLLAEHRISGVPVVDDDRVVGVVSETDIVAKERGRLPRRLWHSTDDKRAARTAGDAMTAPPVTVYGWRSTAGAAAVMLEHDVNRLPVVDDNERLVGILTRADLVRAFARSDSEIEREIRDEVLKRAYWLAQTALTVRVEGGEVVIAGEVDAHAVAETLPSAIERVPGVVSVDANLTWRDPRN